MLSLHNLKISQDVAGSAAGATDPFERSGVAIFDWPVWVGYTFGSLLIVIGLLTFLFFRKTKDRAEAYKAEQLKLYNEKYRRKTTDYKATGMYLPAWEKVKLSWPLFIGVILIFIGIAWMVGNSLTTL